MESEVDFQTTHDLGEVVRPLNKNSLTDCFRYNDQQPPMPIIDKPQGSFADAAQPNRAINIACAQQGY